MTIGSMVVNCGLEREDGGMKGDQACRMNRRVCGDSWAMLGKLQADHPSGMILVTSSIEPC